LQLEVAREQLDHARELREDDDALGRQKDSRLVPVGLRTADIGFMFSSAS
jgi:hypothetical protein